jgi:hypothetical protein
MTWLMTLALLTINGTAEVIAQSTPEPVTPVAVTDATIEPSCPYSNPVQLTWFYKPAEPPNRQGLINNFSFYILTRGDEQLLEGLHLAGEYPILQYLHFDSVHDACHQAELPAGTPCNCDQNVLRNNVGWYKSDVCWIRDNHPDWFLRDKDGNLMYDSDQVMIDPGNVGWQEFWIERVKISQLDVWNGVFLDNLATRFGIHRAEFVELQNYPTIEAYQDAVISFLSNVYENYFVPEKRLLLANISIYVGDDHDDGFLRYLPYLDGVMDEFWAFPRTDYYPVEIWEHRLWRMEQVINAGKIGIMVSQGARDDYPRQSFGLGSYLLLASPDTFFRYTSDQDRGYFNIWLYDNYQRKLGEPVGPYAREGNIWSREFTNGKVTVDVENQKSNTELYDQSEACLPQP